MTPSGLPIASQLFVALTALLHIGFLVLEMFFWTKPVGLRVFRQSLQRAQDSAVLAQNQGLYNGFLAAGLVWGLTHPDLVFAFQIQVFFLTCVCSAAVLGACTVSGRILLVQGGPAAVGLVLLFLV
jgi:putative membrane protein